MQSWCAFLPPPRAFAQDPTGAIEGVVTDKTAGAVAAAKVIVKNTGTGFGREAVSGPDGFYRVTALPVGTYSLTVEAPRFAAFSQSQIPVNVNQAVRVDVQLSVGTVAESVTVAGRVQLVDTSSNALGAVVSGREILDLPLNGRNFTQLGLLQTGVAPLTAGVATAGGSLRQGQAYAVNGMRPEQNVYLVDGAQNINRMDGGYALKLPVDAVAEFRILTQSAPPEFGGTGGATTSVVTRSGSNQFRGNLYEFVRNDAFDAKNYFSEEVEPLKQNQFGGTMGGPLKKDRVMFFGYYEGFRNDQGITTSATVPTPGQRQGDFSDLGVPLINFAAGGVPIPGNRIPAAAINPVALNVHQHVPARQRVAVDLPRDARRPELLRPGRRPHRRQRVLVRSVLRTLFVLRRIQRQPDLRARHRRARAFRRATIWRRTPRPLSENHIFSSAMINSLRGSYLRHKFFFDQRLNQTPPGALGFAYTSSNAEGQGPPFFNVSGYSPIGGAITGPRNSTQNMFELQDALSWTRGAHLVKFGAGYQHTAIDMFQAIAPNAFYVFAGTFPTNNAVANLLLGAPVTFYQGLGDFGRDISVWGASAYAQDEWRVGSRLTLNYGLRYERINPITEAQNRLTGFMPGAQSVVFPIRAQRACVPGRPGHPGRHRAERQRRHAAPGIRVGSDRRRRVVGAGQLRPVLRPVRERRRARRRRCRSAPSRGRSSTSSAARASTSRTRIWGTPIPRRTRSCVRPPCSRSTRRRSLPTRRTGTSACSARCSTSTCWRSATWRRRASGFRRNIENNPAVYGPGATAQNADRRRIYANCPADGGTCDFSTIAMLSYITHSNYEAGQVSLSRRYSGSVGFNISYWLSSTKDELSSMNLSGAAAKALAGENDLAQNPFDVGAEYGPSLFDARHRFVASASWGPRVPDSANSAVRAIFGGWQLNGIATLNSGTPFTVTDSANVSLQANSPPISGFVAAVRTVSAIRTPVRTPSTSG